MRTTLETLTTRQTFTSRVRADDRGDRHLVKLIDRYHHGEASPEDLERLVREVNDYPRPGVLFLKLRDRFAWHSYQLHTSADLTPALARPRVDAERAAYVRGIYPMETISELVLIEQALVPFMEALRAEGCLVEWRLDEANQW